jgi:hypothetical protein
MAINTTYGMLFQINAKDQARIPYQKIFVESLRIFIIIFIYLFINRFIIN